MKERYPYYISYVSMLFNMLFFSIWIYSFEKFERHEDRIVYFGKFIPFDYLDFLLIILSVVSMVVFARSKPLIHKFFLIIQLGFTILLLGQRL